MAKKAVVAVQNLSTAHFNLNQSSKKIEVIFPKNSGIKSGQLVGNNLVITTQANEEVTIPMGSLIPAAKADIFLKSVVYQQNTKSLVFTTGAQDNTSQDNTITVAVSDLLPVVATGAITGNGTTSSPLAIDLNALKPKATVELTDAFDEPIGFAFTSSERSA